LSTFNASADTADLYAQPTATGYQLTIHQKGGIEIIENFSAEYCH
jgi:hypothetical protein